MSGNYKTSQQRVAHRGRDFHFVSYQGERADPARQRVGIPPTWFLMSAGKRWAVVPQVDGQSEAELKEQLVQWLEDNVFVAAAESPLAGSEISPLRAAADQPSGAGRAALRPGVSARRTGRRP